MIDPYDDGSALVRVRAQVMTRDDSSGGWVPMDGGGLSHVSVRKRLLPLPPAPVLIPPPLASSTSAPGSVSSESYTAISVLGPGPAAPPPTPRGPGPPSPSASSHALTTRASGAAIPEGMAVGLGLGHSPGGRHEYQILGRRISDQTVVLSCTIKKDFQYNKVMPTFHHWRTGDKKFGLTFQTAADARAFDKGVRMAVEELLDGWSWEPAQYTLYPVHPWTLWPVVISDWSSVTGTRPSTADVGDDDVFMTLELPMERSETRPPSATSPRTSPSPPNQSSGGQSNHHHLHRMHFLSRKSPSPSPLPLSVPVPALGQGSPGGGVEATEAIWQQREKEKEWEREKERRRREGDIWCWDGISTHGGKESSSERIDVISALADKDKESYSYVQFARGDQHTLPGFHSVHEYSYPMMPDPVSKSSVRNNASLNRKNQVVSAQPPMLPPSLPAKSPASGSSTSTTSASLKRGGLGRHHKKRRGSASNSRSLDKGGSTGGGLLSGGNGKGSRLRCRHCQESYREENNPRGSCDFAPDPVRNCIETVSCLACAQCMLYHCYADAEGDFSPHPCSCSSGSSSGGVGFGVGSNSGGGSGLSSGHGSGASHQSGLGHGSAGRRWLGLALLSLLVPCLCCYLPLKACYKCGVHCGICGQRHAPA